MIKEVFLPSYLTILTKPIPALLFKIAYTSKDICTGVLAPKEQMNVVWHEQIYVCINAV